MNTLKQKNQINKLALVTGGARRIGAAIVKKLHNQNFNVAIHCHQSIKHAQELASQLNSQRANSAWVFQANLKNSSEINKLISAVMKKNINGLDVLINNASVFIPTINGKCSPNQWNELFSINVQAPYRLSMAAYPFLVLKEGVIINLTDIHAQSPLKGYGVYCQTKAALLMQTKALAREFAPCVRVNAVAPGAIMWPEKDNILSRQAQQKIISKTPLSRHGDSSNIAHAVFALIENNFITGETLNVDGGRSI